MTTLARILNRILGTPRNAHIDGHRVHTYGAVTPAQLHAATQR